MRKVLLVALGALFFVCVWKAVDEAQRPRGGGHAWTRADDPFDPDSLRGRMERIAPLVSRVVGDSIDVAQVKIRAVDDRLSAEREFAKKFPELLDTTRDSFRQESVLSERVRLSRRSDLLGLYDSTTNAIELYPDQFDSIVPDSIDGVLDIVVAHELAHAWQDQRYRMFEEVEFEDRDAAFARRAVIEGSAEFVARRVAQELGTASVFDGLAQSARRETEMVRAMGRWPISQRWFYSQGFEFVSVVHDAHQGESVWDRLFGRLPRSVTTIERPRAWLESERSPAASPDDGVQRFLRQFDRGRSASEWQYYPIPSADDRLALAALPLDHRAWQSYRRGVSLSGKPDAGALAKEGVSLRIWWIGTEADALAARASLEQAAKQRGVRSWARRELVTALGPVRTRVGRRGTTAYAQSGMDCMTGEFAEDACAFGNHGPWLFEAITERVGASPALLELVELAIRIWGGDPDGVPVLRGDESGPWDLPADASGAARDGLIARALAKPGGEIEVTAWLAGRTDEPAALLAALGPALGDDEWSTPERSAALVAALRSKDPDVRRFALRQLGQGDFEPRPFAGAIVEPIQEAARSADPELRALAVAAACELELKALLRGASLAKLLADPSAMVRAALARGSEQLTDEAQGQLSRDDDPIVRAAAESSRSQSVWRSMRM
ncbi:MAG: hypothetical protein ACYTEG_17470, partial [Planctomycetota bacterium]